MYACWLLIDSNEAVWQEENALDKFFFMMMIAYAGV